MSECMTQEDAMNMSNEQAIQILKPFRDMMIDQHGCPVSDAVFALDKAIEALSQHQPERKTGKWIIKAVNTFELAYGSTGYEPVYECSICGGVEESYLRLDEPIMPDDADFPSYCPNCGADMRGET